jgi:hypothetical protein
MKTPTMDEIPTGAPLPALAMRALLTLVLITSSDGAAIG